MIAGDLLLDVTQELLKREQSDTLRQLPSCSTTMIAFSAHPKDVRNAGTARCRAQFPTFARRTWPVCSRRFAPGEPTGFPNNIFADPAGRLYAAAFQAIAHSGPANLRVAVVAPVDEFFASILSARARLFVAALAFVGLMVPIVYFAGSLLSRSLRALAEETDRIQKIRAGCCAPGALINPRDRRTGPVGRHDAQRDGDVFAIRAASSRRKPRRDRHADGVGRHAA